MIHLLRWGRMHIGLITEICAYGFWLLVDLATVLGTVSATPFPAIAVPGIVLLRRLPGANLVRTAILAIGISLLVSLAGAMSFPNEDETFLMMSTAEQLALAVLVVLVLQYCALRWALILTTAAAVAIVGSPLLRMAGDEEYSLLAALGWGGAVAVGLVLRELGTRREAAIEEVRTAERMNLARELHDVVAHHVTGIIVAAQAAGVVARSSPAEAERALATIETAGSDALAAMRRMVGVLRGHDEQGARTPGTELHAIRELIDRFDPGWTRTRFTADPGLERSVLPPGVAATAHRVVQEALTNIRRHAPHADAVTVDVWIREETLQVAIQNNGVPPGPVRHRSSGGGFGIIGMNERVAALDGTLTAGPTAPGRWTVAAWLPLRGAQ